MLRFLPFFLLAACAIKAGSTAIKKSDLRGHAPVYALKKLDKTLV